MHLTRRMLLLLLSAAAVCCVAPLAAAAPAAGPAYSSLFPKATSKWAGNKGRLLDLSYAGYKMGEVLPPSPADLPATVNVKDFGAVGDGETECGDAILAAIGSDACKAAAQCVVFFPPGNFSVGRQLSISNSVILRGSGMDVTTLFFPKSLSDINGETGKWSFEPGLINFEGVGRLSYQDEGPLGMTYVTELSKPAAKGSNMIFVWKGLEQLKAGMLIRLTASDPGKGALIRYLTADRCDQVDCSALQGSVNAVCLVTRIKQVLYDEKALLLERKLPFDMQPTSWIDVSVHKFLTTGYDGKSSMGVEDLTVAFPSSTTYAGHLKEEGWNGVFFKLTSNCFARNLRVLNSDFGLSCFYCHWCSFMNVLLTSDRTPWLYENEAGQTKYVFGHHGIWIGSGADNLVTNFTLTQSMVHDISLESSTVNTVFRNGAGPDLTIDFHKDLPYGNLISNLDMGLGTRPFSSGGNADKGPPAASWNTFWHLRSKGKLTLPPANFGPNLNFVAINRKKGGSVPKDWKVEDIANAALTPQDLYNAQVQLRLGRTVYP